MAFFGVALLMVYAVPFFIGRFVPNELLALVIFALAYGALFLAWALPASGQDDTDGLNELFLLFTLVPCVLTFAGGIVMRARRDR